MKKSSIERLRWQAAKLLGKYRSFFEKDIARKRIYEELRYTNLHKRCGARINWENDLGTPFVAVSQSVSPIQSEK